MAYRNISRTLHKQLSAQDRATLAGRGCYEVPLMTYQDQRDEDYEGFRCLWCRQLVYTFAALEDHVAIEHVGLTRAQIDERRRQAPRIEIRRVA